MTRAGAPTPWAPTGVRFGPKQTRPDPVGYWENVIKQRVDTPEWKAEMARVNGRTDLVPSARFRKYVDEA